MASESVALDVMGFKLVRDVAPGEAILIDTTEGRFHSRQCAGHGDCAVHVRVRLSGPPDSLIDGISVYDARIKMGEFLARKLRATMPHLKIDVVIPIPDSSRRRQWRWPIISTSRIAKASSRTAISAALSSCRAGRSAKSVRQKLNTIHQEFKGKSVLLVDDSIVRDDQPRDRPDGPRCRCDQGLYSVWRRPRYVTPADGIDDRPRN